MIPKPLALVGRRDPILTARAVDVVDFDDKLVELVERMEYTAMVKQGLALAAPQIGRGIRLVAGPHGANTLANPTIIEAHGTQIGNEGCLTFPGRWYWVERAARVVVEGIDPRTGEPKVIRADDLTARLWQHEIDHLDGILIADRYPEVSL